MCKLFQGHLNYYWNAGLQQGPREGVKMYVVTPYN